MYRSRLTGGGREHLDRLNAPRGHRRCGEADFVHRLEPVVSGQERHSGCDGALPFVGLEVVEGGEGSLNGGRAGVDADAGQLSSDGGEQRLGDLGEHLVGDHLAAGVPGNVLQSFLFLPTDVL